MPEMEYEKLSSMQKAAVALIAFGAEVSALVLKGMNEKDLERITIEIANMRDVPADIEKRVIEDCHDIFIARQYISQGGVDFAKTILEKAVGPTRAKEILSRLESSLYSKGFSLLKDIDPKQLSQFLQSEHPQTISLILTQLAPAHSASVLSEFAGELQAEVALRIATMEKIAPEILGEIEQTLEGHFEKGGSSSMSATGGAKAMAELLNLMDTTAEKNIMLSLEADDADLAAEIKNMMFVFDDIVLLDDRSVQKVLKEVETKDLSIALKATSDEVKNKIFSNVSERVSKMVAEEMEYMGPTRLSDVETAQSRIVEVIRRLEDEGQIFISGRGGKEDIIV